MRVLDFADGFTSPTAPTTTATPASDIAVTPSGNLASTNAQAALVELQGDINTINGKIGAANGIASLGADSKIPAAQIPLVALVDVNVVANIAARDALTVQEGDVAVVTDAGSGVSKTYIYNGSSWTELITDGSLYAHIIDGTDAHAASAITNTPSGNTAATTVQGAINELQTDIDTRLSALTGDVTASGGGSQAATIANDAVTNAKAANMAQSTIKGRAVSAGTGDPTDLTPTQATAILDAVVGDSGSGGTKGLVPAPAAGDSAAGKFLKADGSWTAPTAATAPDQSYEVSNLGLSVTQSSGILTAALKNKSGSNASGGDEVKVGMRNSTATTGQYTQRTVSAALSQTLSVWTTLGLVTTVANYIYVYLIDSNGSGTMKLGFASTRYDDGTLMSTVAESFTFTSTSATPAVITANGHGLQNGNAIIPTNSGGGLPTGITANTVYYVKSVAANTFQIALTPDGTSINTSSTGTGTHTFHVADGALVSDAVYASKAIRCIGRVLLTHTAGSWNSPTEVSLLPADTGRQVVAGPLHSGNPTTTSGSFADVSSPKLYVLFIPGKTGRYKISCNIVLAVSATGIRAQYKFNAAVGSPTTVFSGYTNYDSGAESTQVHSQFLQSVFWLTAGVPYAFNVQNATSSGTLTTRTDLGGPSGTSVIAEYAD